MKRALSDRIEDNLSSLLAKAEIILRDNRRKVLAVAHALEIHKTLSGDDVVAVIEGKIGTIADGRHYLVEENMVAIEAYHGAAVKAHAGHKKPDIEIPKFDQL